MAKKQRQFRVRRLILSLIVVIFSAGITYFNETLWQKTSTVQIDTELALENLSALEVKGRAPKTGYTRDQFGNGWQTHSDGCDTRNKILKRDLKNTTENAKCQILTGVLDDPYTGNLINFARADNASAVQIDHVVALSDAWQKGAQQLTAEKRIELANDPLNLLAVDGPANQQKGDSDAASWLPANKAFRCQYVERQISVKKRYNLWITTAERDAIQKIMQNC